MHQPSRHTLGFALLVVAMATVFLSNTTLAQTITLYQNDFETPNVPPVLACGYALDVRSINTLYGGQGGDFTQINTVETVLINEPAALGAPQEYSDPDGRGGNYAIGMLSALQNDRLALTFDGQGLPFINIGLDISSIDVWGCGGPVGVAVPSYRISLLDSPGGVFAWNNAVLDEAIITGEAAPDQWTFQWTNHVLALDASGSTDGNISIVWDLLQSGYGAFDNLIIASSVDPGDLTHSVGGTVTGLNGSVTLQNNGGDDLVLSSDGGFTFITGLVDGASYSVSVLTQPTGQTCSVTNDSGTIAAADVTNVTVTCVTDVIPTYSVGGTVSGLTGTGLALQNNGADTLPVATDGSFTFVTELVDTTTYSVTVSTQPTGQTCSVTNGSGVIAAADVSDVDVACVDDVVPPVVPPASAVPIPTASQWALIMLSLLLSLIVFTNRKRLF